jgi:hypothetical protein
MKGVENGLENSSHRHPSRRGEHKWSTFPGSLHFYFDLLINRFLRLILPHPNSGFGIRLIKRWSEILPDYSIQVPKRILIGHDTNVSSVVSMHGLSLHTALVSGWTRSFDGQVAAPNV